MNNTTIENAASEQGLYYRMTQQTTNDDINTTNELKGNVTSFTITTNDNATDITGAELMAALAELSFSIIHDKTYTGDYIIIHNLIRSINNSR